MKNRLFVFLFALTLIVGAEPSVTLVSAQPFNQIKSFAPLVLNPVTGFSTNSDGAHPQADLISSGDTLYGVAAAGGVGGAGTIFKINTDGSGFTLLKSFTSADSGTNSDGASPEARLILSDGILYGTTYRGGSFSNGTVFKVVTDSTGFGVLKTFSVFGPSSFGQKTNSDGGNSLGRLVFFGGAVYGTASFGGESGAGTIFKVNTNGSNFTVLKTFAEINGFGGVPAAGLLLLGNTFYGTTEFGGEGNSGTIFSLPIPGPQLAINRSETNAVLTWSTNDIGYTLESTPALGPSAVWNTVSPPPSIVNSLNTVTNPMPGPAKFYRLTQ